MKVSFTIKATAWAFVKFLENFTKGGELNPVPYEGRSIYLLPYMGGPPDKQFGSLVHEHENLQGRILALWADKVSMTEDGCERTDYDEGVAIGFKWTQIDEKLRMTVECFEPVAKDCFVGLLTEIRSIWPESREDIDEHLKALGVEGTTAEPEQVALMGDQGRNTSKARRKLGHHGGTMDRVRETRELIVGGEKTTNACRRVGIDPRTYDKYVLDVTCPEEEPEAD